MLSRDEKAMGKLLELKPDEYLRSGVQGGRADPLGRLLRTCL